MTSGLKRGELTQIYKDMGYLQKSFLEQESLCKELLQHTSLAQDTGIMFGILIF